MNTTTSSWLKTTASLLAARLPASCAGHVEMPKGTSKGFSSARLIQRDSAAPAITNPTEKQVQGLIQD
jgi:hypothetical protein